MKSEIKTYTYPNGELQRVQLIRSDSWDELQFFSPEFSPRSFDCFCDIYTRYLVPACPWIFGHMVLFRLREDVCTQIPMESGRYGSFDSKLSAAAALFREDVRIRGGKPHFSDERSRKLWQELEAKGLIRIISGRLPTTTIIPVDNTAGFMTESFAEASFKVNCGFFIMDRFDCASVYDRVGTPFGMMIKNGKLLSPPLFDREALIVRQDGSVSVEAPSLADLTIRIGEREYRQGVNARLFSRPECKKIRAKGRKLVIIGDRVAAVSDGAVTVPASGFVLLSNKAEGVKPGDKVEYPGMENVRFALQVGNSIIINGVKTRCFISRFYNIRKLQPVPFPPSLYPMDFEKARAARIALGADSGGKPMLLWAEGAPKLGYIPGQHSCGASLSELSDICGDVGMVNAVNLDGGGSAQMLIDNKRRLAVSDRNEADFSEAERAVPLGIMIK